MSTCLVPRQNESGKRFLSNMKKGGSFQTALVLEMANIFVSSAHRIMPHDILLMAFVDPRYEFLFVDAGCQGSASDRGVLRSTKLWRALKEKSLYLPPAKPFFSTDQFCEYDEDHRLPNE